MKIVVLKFGGTSVGSKKNIKKVAEIVTSYKKKKIQSHSRFICNERCDK